MQQSTHRALVALQYSTLKPAAGTSPQRPSTSAMVVRCCGSQRGSEAAAAPNQASSQDCCGTYDSLAEAEGLQQADSSRSSSSVSYSGQQTGSEHRSYQQQGKLSAVIRHLVSLMLCVQSGGAAARLAINHHPATAAAPHATQGMAGRHAATQTTMSSSQPPRQTHTMHFKHGAPAKTHARPAALY
jgi:hypothetical protein